ncbi:enoyl-[acyl-carrier-protein] reductase, mitochondrial [Diachasma alloeum]|uniref:enoyl-[acyl-carrier-protein] reductase, mitochondrial n=1 Tax=Diachasma alloeum TaxID=454923 RepID=UPI000738444B|nr:enoyl-[acyl-carrier-protein] reductase, mitochondrial [Diachasma alloeum]
MVLRVGKLVLMTSRIQWGKCSMMKRGMSASGVNFGKSLVYEGYGEPIEVLKLKNTEDCKPGVNEVAVRWILAPVNPADINTIQGKYPSKPKLPAVAGNEGVGEVVDVGEGVKAVGVGDKVVPNRSNTGTWSSRRVYPVEEVLKIPGNFTDVEASMLNVNPCTAYRMLKDFVPLCPGDTVIQNGGNSAVGQLVIQLCRAWGLNSVNVVRDRGDIGELKDHLKCLGATEVLTESEIRTTDLFKSKKLPAPKLALNCVCGESGVNILRHLAHSGTIVTYGAMSREPLTIPASALIFKDVTAKGFWMSAWVKAHSNSQERWEMLDDLGKLFSSKKIQAPPHKIIPLSEYQEAVKNTLQLDGKTGIKYILDVSA